MKGRQQLHLLNKIEGMFGLSDLKKTRVYQEGAREEKDI